MEFSRDATGEEVVKYLRIYETFSANVLITSAMNCTSSLK